MVAFLAALRLLRYWFGDVQVVALVERMGVEGGGGEPPPRWLASSSP